MRRAASNGRSIARSVLGGCIALALVVGACGSDDSGDGTSKTDCSPNDTRACVGPGACQGGQACGADGKWSACDCGGGTGGVGGTSGAGGSVGGAGAIDGSAGATMGGAGGADGAAGSGGSCPSGKGPEMAIVGTFCVDTSEVTQAQYAAFLSAKGTDTSGQPKTECEWNTSYEPAFFTWGTNEASLTFCSNATKFDPATKPNHPVSCIDWCDARAFCEWAGKRLCGGIGGVKVDNWNSLDPQVAEWPYVATNGAKDTQWPYPAESQCVIGGAANEPVKNRPLCHGTPAPFDAVFDLSGNVAEWADDCDPGWGPGGPTAECRAHGGSGQSSVQSANWNSYETFSRDTTRGRVGFRCCANATQ